MLEVDLFGGAPRRVRGFEEMFWADDFAFEESCKGWVVIGEAYEDYQLGRMKMGRSGGRTLYSQVPA